MTRDAAVCLVVANSGYESRLGDRIEEDPTGLLNEGFRYRDLETGCFITRDPLGFKDGPNLYTYVKQNPWTKFDPEGLEGVVVSGQPGDHKNRTHFLANGLDRAKKLAKQFASEKKGEKATWMIYNEGGKGGYSQKDLDEYKAKAAKAGVEVKIVKSAKEIVEYTNEKTGGDSRSKDKITNFSYFGHATPGELDPGFVDHGFWNMATMQSVEPGAFESSAFAKGANINLLGGCRTAVSGNLGSFLTPSAIDQFATKVDDKSTIKGSTSRVFYSGGVVSDQDLPSKTEGGKIQEIHGVNNNNLPDSYFTPSFPIPTR